MKKLFLVVFVFVAIAVAGVGMRADAQVSPTYEARLSILDEADGARDGYITEVHRDGGISKLNTAQLLAIANGEINIEGLPVKKNLIQNKEKYAPNGSLNEDEVGYTVFLGLNSFGNPSYKIVSPELAPALIVYPNLQGLADVINDLSEETLVTLEGLIAAAIVPAKTYTAPELESLEDLMGWVES